MRESREREGRNLRRKEAGWGGDSRVREGREREGKDGRREGAGWDGDSRMREGRESERGKGWKEKTVAKALHGQRFPMPPY